MMIVRNANFSGHTRRQTLCLVAVSDLQPTNNGKLHGGGLLPPFTFNHTNRSLSPSSSTQLFVTTNPDHTLPRTTQNQESSPISPGRPPEHRVSLSLVLLLLLLDDDDDDDGSPEKPVSRITSPQPCLLPMEIFRTLVPGPAQQTLTRKSERSLALSSRGSSGSECRAWPQHSKLVNTSASATQKGFRGDWKNCYVFSRDDGATFDDQPSTSGASLWTAAATAAGSQSKDGRTHHTKQYCARKFCFLLRRFVFVR